MPINPSRTTQEVFGDNMFADVMDMFLIDEPSDLLSLAPPFAGGAARGASAANLAIREAASPSANMARKMFGGAGSRVDDAMALLKKLGAKTDDLARPAAEALDPRSAELIDETLLRRIQADTNPVDLLDRFHLVRSVLLGEPSRNVLGGAFEGIMDFVNDQIEAERKRTGGQGLAGLF